MLQFVSSIESHCSLFRFTLHSKASVRSLMNDRTFCHVYIVGVKESFAFKMTITLRRVISVSFFFIFKST